MNNHKINAKRHWTIDSIREACIRNQLYTSGTYEEYFAMLEMIKTMNPTYENLYTIAYDIKEHSDDQTITNIMFILEREAITTTFEIDGSDEI